jgi:hypothetical protein
MWPAVVARDPRTIGIPRRVISRAVRKIPLTDRRHSGTARSNLWTSVASGPSQRRMSWHVVCDSMDQNGKCD